jgi:hypothetical protein
MDEHSEACCDCGLAHRFKPAVRKGKFGFQVFRDKECTTILRQKDMKMVSAEAIAMVLASLREDITALEELAAKLLDKGDPQHAATLGGIKKRMSKIRWAIQDYDAGTKEMKKP